MIDTPQPTAEEGVVKGKSLVQISTCVLTDIKNYYLHNPPPPQEIWARMSTGVRDL